MPTDVIKANQRLRTEIGKKSGGKSERPIQDDVEYSDDAAPLIEQDTREQMFGRMGNYEISAETRDLKIQ